MKKVAITMGLLAAMLIVLTGCVAGPNPAVNVPSEEGRVAGFWQGLWHGVIAPVTFIISLFSDNVHVYEVHNNGNWYVFGFLLGLTALWGGGGRASSARRR